jgi:anti-sigma B factor antagonist
MELIFQEVDGDVTIISLDGGLDGTTSTQLRDGVEKLINVGLRRIIVDCNKLGYVSSAGIGTLITLHRRMKNAGGQVKIAGATGAVFEVLELMNLGTILELYPDVDRALLAFRPPDAADDAPDAAEPDPGPFPPQTTG